MFVVGAHVCAGEPPACAEDRFHDAIGQIVGMLLVKLPLMPMTGPLSMALQQYRFLVMIIQGRAEMQVSGLLHLLAWCAADLSRHAESVG